MTGRPPVIVVGMHRSGTSILTRLLDDLGLFVGRDVDGHHESRHFQWINKWMLRETGFTWDRPEGIEALEDRDDVVAPLADHADFLLASARSASYLGWLRYLRTGSPAGLSSPWGWKDPRTSLLLPVWRRLFPEARVVHIRRHGVDVAASLRRRHTGKVEDWQGKDARAVDGIADALHWLRPGWYQPRKGEVVGSLRSLDLEGGLSLWRTYLDRIASSLQAHDGPVHELRYEDLLEDPEPRLETVAGFCDLDPSPGAVEGAADDLDRDRAYRYRDDEELAAFADDHAAALRDAGYDASTP